MSAVIYPVIAAWTWGGGWLENLGFHDFAGSGPVHLGGGWAGMIGTILLGPRLGFFKSSNNAFKKSKDNKVQPAGLHWDKYSQDTKATEVGHKIKTTFR